MQGSLFVTFPQLEAPPGFAALVQRHFDELAEHCHGVRSCTVHVDRERAAPGAAARYRVRLCLGPRRCDPAAPPGSLAETADEDVALALRRAFDHARRVVGRCQPLPPVARPWPMPVALH